MDTQKQIEMLAGDGNTAPDNLRIYRQVSTTPLEARKKIGGGKLSGYTDINPMWRIKKLTEVYGPVGLGWYLEELGTEYVEGPTQKPEKAVIVTLALYVKQDGEWSKPIIGKGGNTVVQSDKNGLWVNDEAHKSAFTDAIGSCVKLLGFSADIYFERDRDSKYENPPDGGAPAAVKPNPTVTTPAAKPLEAVQPSERMTVIADIRKLLNKGIQHEGKLFSEKTLCSKYKVGQLDDLDIAMLTGAKARLEAMLKERDAAAGAGIPIGGFDETASVKV
jgi:hypothetical protein